VTRFAIGLGSNLGDRLDHLAGACRQLEERFEIVAVSPLYESEPVGGPEQDPFLNAVALVDTEESPLDVLATLQEVERGHGRQREVRWGPRTLDLDLITSDGPPHSDDRLTLPHPRAIAREFVLRPLADVWPKAPLDDLDAATAADRLEPQGVDRLARDWVPPVSHLKAHLLLAGQLGIILAVALAFAVDGTLPGGEVTVIRALGGAVAFVGLMLAFISSRRLGRSMTASPIPRAGAELIIGGPYRFARHPIYGGLCLFMMGTALFLDSLLGFVAAATLIPYFMLKARFEERQLRIRFAGYLAYRETVHRWLIPFVF
jgi:2-amino-4-hydroxy-6-hydroxymethyldihydropteridine diphosphokinase